MKEILVQTSEEQTRAALLEEGQLVEIYIERSLNQRLAGNIYKGRVENVLPGMQAAFVNIGLEKNAFLYVGDAVPPQSIGEDGEPQELEHVLHIQDVLKEGQEILVQIMKEPVGSKGARITTNVTLPGRYMVLMPSVDYVGISRRIEEEEERMRLKDLAGGLKPSGMGLIVRTVAEGLLAGDLEQDVQGLLHLWQGIYNRFENVSAPALLHKDLELVERILRDMLTEDVDQMIVNNPFVYEKLQESVDTLAPGFKGKISLAENQELFEEYGIEQEIEKALRRRAWLKCGGYLVIDQTEALTVIDVNTGKYVGSTNLEDTVLNTNMEAAAEIARQLRLRNTGGIIIIDFIDMVDPEHQAKVLEILERECKKDKIKTNILGLTQLGLVEMTRKKVRKGLESVMLRSCPLCEGTGKVASEETIGLKAKQEIFSTAKRTEAPGILLEAHPLLAAHLIGSGGVGLQEIERKAGKQVLVRGVNNLRLEEFRVQAVHSPQELASLSSPLLVGQVLELYVDEPHATQPQAGIARVEGFVVNVEGGGAYVGQKVLAEITKVQRTSARAKLI